MKREKIKLGEDAFEVLLTKKEDEEFKTIKDKITSQGTFNPDDFVEYDELMLRVLGNPEWACKAKYVGGKIVVKGVEG